MLSRRFVPLLLLSLVLSGLGFGQTHWLVAQPVVNMYAGPTLDKDVTSQAIYGVTVQQVPSTDAAPDGWVEVRTPDDYTGWVQRAGLLSLAEKESYARADKRVVRVSNRSANVYREMDVTEHAPVLRCRSNSHSR